MYTNGKSAILSPLSPPSLQPKICISQSEISHFIGANYQIKICISQSEISHFIGAMRQIKI
jgi:hypothetical protein